MKFDDYSEIQIDDYYFIETEAEGGKGFISVKIAATVFSYKIECRPTAKELFLLHSLEKCS